MTLATTVVSRTFNLNDLFWCEDIRSVSLLKWNTLVDNMNNTSTSLLISYIPFVCSTVGCDLRRVWRYLRGNQNPKNRRTEKGQKDKQRSTKHTNKTKDRVTRIPLKTGAESKCPDRVSSSTVDIGRLGWHYKHHQHQPTENVHTISM